MCFFRVLKDWFVKQQIILDFSKKFSSSMFLFQYLLHLYFIFFELGKENLKTVKYYILWDFVISQIISIHFLLLKSSLEFYIFLVKLACIIALQPIEERFHTCDTFKRQFYVVKPVCYLICIIQKPFSDHKIE